MENTILSIIKKGPEPEHTICYCVVTYNFLHLDLLPALEDNFLPQALAYCDRRDSSTNSKKFARAKSIAERDLKTLFDVHSDVKIILQSSYGARMHIETIDGKSDIDFGMLIMNMTENKVKKYGQLLECLGFVFVKPIWDYYVYSKEIDGIDIEVKIRDAEKSARVVELHAYLDALPVETQQLLAYAKSIAYADGESYNKLKKIIYTAYNTEITMLNSF